MKLIEYVRAAFVWTKAIDLASKSKYQSALIKLDSISSIYAGKRVRYHILRGFLKFAIDSFSESTQDFIIAEKLLRRSNYFSEHDRSYLNCYIAVYGNLSQSYLESCDQKLFQKPDYSTVDLEKVRTFIKSQFPLTTHPDWNRVMGSDL